MPRLQDNWVSNTHTHICARMSRGQAHVGTHEASFCLCLTYVRRNADGVVTIKLNRPEARNALSMALLQDLSEHLHHTSSDVSAKVVVIEGEGPVFSSGHDLKELNQCQRSEHKHLFDLCSAVMSKIAELPQPVIAKVCCGRVAPSSLSLPGSCSTKMRDCPAIISFSLCI